MQCFTLGLQLFGFGIHAMYILLSTAVQQSSTEELQITGITPRPSSAVAVQMQFFSVEDLL